MALSKNRISEIFYLALTDDCYKNIVRLKTKEYSESTDKEKQKLRKKNPDFIYLYDLIDNKR